MLDRIKAALPSLAPAEQRVGRLCLADPRAFAKLPVSELADRSHVSKPTVVRFCRSVGYDGLSDFKLKQAGTVNEGVPFIHRSVDADDKTSDVTVKVIDNTVAAFLKYRNDASTVAIEKAGIALVDAGVTGFLAVPGRVSQFADFIARLANDADLRAKMGAAARERALGFGWDKTMARILGYYRDVLAADAL